MCGHNAFRKTDRKGFTIIELLVVVAILALLAGILSPVFARVREQAKIGVSVSNVSQISKGVLLYAADNDDWTPRVVSDLTVEGVRRGDLPGDLPADAFDYLKGQQTLKQVLRQYLRAEGVWRSPNDRPIEVNGVPMFPSRQSLYDYGGSSYGFLISELCAGPVGRIQEPSRSGWLREGVAFVRNGAVFGRTDGSVRFKEWSLGSEELNRTEVDFGCR